MRKRTGQFKPTLITLATAFADQADGGELIIPETFDGMERQDVQALYDTAVEQFDALYAEYADTMTPEQIETLAALTTGIEALSSEISARDAEAAERAEAAAALASRVEALRSNTDEDGAASDEDDADGAGASADEDEDEEPAADDESAAQTIVASGRSEVRVPLSSVRRNNPQPRQEEKPGMRSVALSAGEGTGFAVGEGLDWLGIGRAIDRKLTGYNPTQFANAAKMGRARKEQHSIVTFKRDFGADLTVTSSDRDHVDSVINRAVDESRLPQGSLVASGGWCAPSETLYDLLELETRSGLLSLPEIGVTRGGISFTPGPSFADIFSDITGFAFTEQDDVDGKYQAGDDGNEVGPKPCYKIDCPDFVEARLEAAGLCLTAGLLQSKGYPEVIARVVRGALVAHEHRMNATLIQRLVSGSTAVNMGSQVGAAAPLLDSIEKQVQHYRYTHRLSDTASLEAVLPTWVRGAVRSDLSRRLGVDLIDVPDSRIDGWFRSRGVNPQFVYNWQALDTTAAGSFTAWPTSVSFLLYSAGTWVRGSSDIITLDTMYDSTLLGTNDYTALFTEEGWLVAKRGFDSRVVTVGIEASGGTHMGVDIAHNGTLVAAAAAAGSSEENPLFTSEVTS